jgi:hypothetical protein
MNAGTAKGTNLSKKRTRKGAEAIDVMDDDVPTEAKSRNRRERRVVEQEQQQEREHVDAAVLATAIARDRINRSRRAEKRANHQNEVMNVNLTIVNPQNIPTPSPKLIHTPGNLNIDIPSQSNTLDSMNTTTSTTIRALHIPLSSNLSNINDGDLSPALFTIDTIPNNLLHYNS